MNYFLDDDGVYPTGMTAHELMHHMNMSDKLLKPSPEFLDRWGYVVNHGNIIYKNRSTRLEDLSAMFGQDKNGMLKGVDIPSDTSTIETADFTEKRGVMLVITRLVNTPDTESGVNITMTLLSAAKINVLFRGITIDAVLETL